MDGKLPHYFRTYRKKHGLCKKQMAFLLGKSPNYVERLERGFYKPNIHVITCYQLLFGVEPKELVPEFYNDLHNLLKTRVEDKPHLFRDKFIRRLVKQRLGTNAEVDTLKLCNMNIEKDDSQRVLSIYPTRSGLSFSYFEGARKLIDFDNWGCTPQNLNEKLHSLINKYQPEAIVTEDAKGSGYDRGDKILSMLNEICQVAKSNNIYLKRYSRSMVKGVFDCFEAHNKYEVAQLLAIWFEGLSIKLPPEPEVWREKHYRMSLFDSVAQAVAFFYTES